MVDITFTFTVLFVAGRDVVEASFFEFADNRTSVYIKRCIIRTIMIIICIVSGMIRRFSNLIFPRQSLAMPLRDNFAQAINLITGLTFSSLCFIFPPVVYLMQLWPVQYRRAMHDAWRRRYMLLICGVNVGIIMIGAVTAVYTTVGAIQGIVSPPPTPTPMPTAPM